MKKKYPAVTLHETCPQLDLEQWGTVVKLAASLMSGFWPLANPGENVIEAAEQAGWEDYQNQWNFSALMKAGLISLIRGFDSE